MKLNTRRIAVSSVLATAFTSVVVIGAAGAAPAYAHDASGTLWGGRPPALFGRAKGGVKSSHRRVWICDLYAEGWGARTRYWTDRGGYDIVGDSNGAESGCGEEATYDGGRVVQFQVCVGANGANHECTVYFPA